MKRIISFIVCLVLLMSLCCVTASAEGTTTITGNNSVTAGSNIDLTVKVSGCPDVSSIAVAITLDSNLEFVSGSWLIAGSLDTVDAAKLKASIMPNSKDVNTNIFKITLKAKTASATAQNVKVNVIGRNGSTEVMNHTATKAISINCSSHDYGAWENASTTQHKHVCKDCGKTETKNHTWDKGTVTKEANCKEAGVKTYKCSTCNATKEEAIAKTTTHSYSSWTQTKAPTCTEKGQESRTCSNCQKVETRDIKATGHTMGAWTTTKEASCTEKGEQTRTCANCTHKETKAINALGHKFENATVTKVPTCTEKGEESGTCTRCGQETTNPIKATGHKVNDYKVTKEPTCTDAGTKEGTCSVCDAKVKTSIAATGHTFGEAEVTKEPTETEEGLKTSTCTVCGETKEETIPVITVEPEVTPDDAIDNVDNDKVPTDYILWIVLAAAAVVLVGGAAVVIVVVAKKKKA